MQILSARDILRKIMLENNTITYNAKAETPVLWPPHAKSWLIGKDSDAGRDWGQEEKGMTEDGWDGWMESLTRWTWVWVNSGSWWWTGRPGVLRFMGSQRVGLDWATELNWTELFQYIGFIKFIYVSWLFLWLNFPVKLSRSGVFFEGKNFHLWFSFFNDYRVSMLQVLNFYKLAISSKFSGLFGEIVGLLKQYLYYLFSYLMTCNVFLFSFSMSSACALRVSVCWHSVLYVLSCSGVTDSLRHHGLQPPGSSVSGIFLARILE